MVLKLDRSVESVVDVAALEAGLSRALQDFVGKREGYPHAHCKRCGVTKKLRIVGFSCHELSTPEGNWTVTCSSPIDDGWVRMTIPLEYGCSPSDVSYCPACVPAIRRVLEESGAL